MQWSMGGTDGRMDEHCTYIDSATDLWAVSITAMCGQGTRYPTHREMVPMTTLSSLTCLLRHRTTPSMDSSRQLHTLWSCMPVLRSALDRHAQTTSGLPSRQVFVVCHSKHTHTHTHTPIYRPFFRDYPGKPVPDSELHFFFLVIISPPEQWSLQWFSLFRPL